MGIRTQRPMPRKSKKSTRRSKGFAHRSSPSIMVLVVAAVEVAGLKKMRRKPMMSCEQPANFELFQLECYGHSLTYFYFAVFGLPSKTFCSFEDAFPFKMGTSRNFV